MLELHHNFGKFSEKLRSTCTRTTGTRLTSDLSKSGTAYEDLYPTRLPPPDAAGHPSSLHDHELHDTVRPLVNSVLNSVVLG